MYVLPPSQIKRPIFLFGMSKINSLVSLLGHNQCTISHNSKQVLILTVDYFESSVSLKTCESQTELLTWGWRKYNIIYQIGGGGKDLIFPLKRGMQNSTLLHSRFIYFPA